MKTTMVTAILLTLFLASMWGMAFNVSPATAAISGTNVKGYWHFDEGAGNIAYDSSDYANDGILSGGKFGNALKFDGVDDYVNIPDNPTLDITGDITLEAWIWIKSFSTSEGLHMYIVGKDTSSERSYGIAVDLTWMYPQTPAFIVFDPTGYWKIAWGTTTLATETWYHIAGTYDAFTGDLKLYLNGVLESTEPSTITSIKSGTADLRIGARQYPGHRSFFNGIIDEVRISNTPRTSFDLTAAPSVDANTVGLWHFDEGTGTTAYDASSNMNHGTINGATWAGNYPEWVPGKYGSALYFDGIFTGTQTDSDYVLVPGKPGSSLYITDEITVDAWIKPTGVPDRWYGDTARLGYGYELTLRGDGKLEIALRRSGAWSWWDSISAIPIPATDFYHVAFTYNSSGGANNLKIYINGVLDAQYTAGPEALESSGDFWIGPWFWPFEGVIDEVRVWDVALPPEVIAVAATGQMEYLDMAGLVLFTSVFEGLTDGSTITIYILPFDPSVSIQSTNPIYIHRVTPRRTGKGAGITYTDLEGFSVKVTVTSFGLPPSKTIHLWLYLSTGEHIGVNLQRAR